MYVIVHDKYLPDIEIDTYLGLVLHNEPDALSNQKLPWNPAEIRVFKTRISA